MKNDRDENWSNSMLNKKKEKWQEGVFTGPRAPLGYHINKFPKRHLIIDEPMKDIIRMLFNLILSGHSVNHVVVSLNQARISTPEEYPKSGFIYVNKSEKKKEWTYKMLLRIFQNRIYTGCLEHGKKVWIETDEGKKQVEQQEVQIIDDTHEAIINKEEFAKVQINLAKGSSGSIADRVFSSYEDALYCAVCGKKLRKKIRGKYIYYGCLDSMKNGEVIKGCEGIKIERTPLLKELERLDWSVGHGTLKLGKNENNIIELVAFMDII